MKPHVVWAHDAPFPYMIERFDMLVRRGNIALDVWFWGHRTSYSQAWTFDERAWTFPHRFLPSMPWRWGTRLGAPTPLLVPGARLPDLVVSLYVNPQVNAPIWWPAYRRGVRTAFASETRIDAWSGRRHWWDAKLDRYMFARIDGAITVGADGRSFVRQRGTPDERVHIARHGIDAARFAREAETARPEREALRASLGLSGVCFVYVGRLSEGKGLDTLLDAFAVLQRRIPDVSLLLVGGGGEEPRLRARCGVEGLRNVIFAGFRGADALPALYDAADVFVFPSLGDPYGLVVDEAMACSLPVISTRVGEIEDRVADGVNGFVVPRGNSAALLDRMETLGGDPDLRARLGRASAVRIADRSPERWADDVERAVEKILAQPRSVDDRARRG